jgi:hypothetical protein
VKREGETVTLVTGAGARAITPDAIPRQTAWLPAVRCSESTASVASGAPATTSGAATGGAATGTGAS